MQESENFTKAALSALDNLSTELLLKKISSENLESIYKVCMYIHTYIHIYYTNMVMIIFSNGVQHLEHWLQSSEEIERKRAVNCLSNLLETYYSELEKNPFEVRLAQSR